MSRFSTPFLKMTIDGRRVGSHPSGQRQTDKQRQVQHAHVAWFAYVHVLKVGQTDRKTYTKDRRHILPVLMEEELAATRLGSARPTSRDNPNTHMLRGLHSEGFQPDSTKKKKGDVPAWLEPTCKRFDKQTIIHTIDIYLPVLMEEELAATHLGSARPTSRDSPSTHMLRSLHMSTCKRFDKQTIIHTKDISLPVLIEEEFAATHLGSARPTSRDRPSTHMLRGLRMSTCRRFDKPTAVIMPTKRNST